MGKRKLPLLHLLKKRLLSSFEKKKGGIAYHSICKNMEHEGGGSEGPGRPLHRGGGGFLQIGRKRAMWYLSQKGEEGGGKKEERYHRNLGDEGRKKMSRREKIPVRRSRKKAPVFLFGGRRRGYPRGAWKKERRGGCSTEPMSWRFTEFLASSKKRWRAHHSVRGEKSKKRIYDVPPKLTRARNFLEAKWVSYLIKRSRMAKCVQRLDRWPEKGPASSQKRSHRGS